jgi:ATP-dependent Clp protease protease subunit
MNNIIPSVVNDKNGEKRYTDLYSSMLDERVIYLTGTICEASAELVVAQLLYLQHKVPDKNITIYIDSPGGEIYQGLAIIDTMQHISCPVSTVCVGRAMSMAAVILACGDKGRRHALPQSTVMIHQALSGANGQISDLEISLNEGKRLNNTTVGLLAEATGKSRKEVKKDVNRDHYMDAKDAQEYGIIDTILEPRKQHATALKTQE